MHDGISFHYFFLSLATLLPLSDATFKLIRVVLWQSPATTYDVEEHLPYNCREFVVERVGFGSCGIKLNGR